MALDILDKISPSLQKSIIYNYLGQKTTFVKYRCLNDIKSRDQETLIKENIEVLENNIKRNPYLVTNWILAGEYSNILIKEKNKLTENVFVETQESLELKNKADYFFKKALELSPNRQLILKDWADTNTVTGEYAQAEEKLNKCIELNPSYARCYWYMALNKGYQKDYQGLEQYSQLAKERNYGIDLRESLQELINMYIRNNDYEGMLTVYPGLIEKTPEPLEKAQLYASYAAAYQQTGQIEKAREQVLKILDIVPSLPLNLQHQVRKDVESFLEILQ
tara:strand:- start:166 stop:999 length:834 start_codon:yes stop_codon:yes gene_type:complete